MSASNVHTLNRMLEWRERKLIAFPNDPAATFYREEISALRRAIKLEEGFAATIDPPQGLAWDHHFAIHADCDWDWIGAVSRWRAEERRKIENS